MAVFIEFIIVSGITPFPPKISTSDEEVKFVFK
jgi:hypothetical protein